MRGRFLGFGLLAGMAFGQVAGTADLDAKLPVHTLVREDLFAGFLVNDMARFEAGERRVEALLQERPTSRASLLAWKGIALLYRAARAHEAGDGKEFERLWASAKSTFGEAWDLRVQSTGGVQSIQGGAFVLFADRLPEPQKKEGWQLGYQAFQELWGAQKDILEKLPLHHKGELLAGMTMTAQRTGRKAEAEENLERMLTALAGTPYESRARRWKENPAIAARTNLGCQTCHDPGTLEARREAVRKQMVSAARP